MEQWKKKLEAYRNDFLENRLLQNILTWVIVIFLLSLVAQFDGESIWAERIGAILGITLMVALPIYVTNLFVYSLWKKQKYIFAIIAYLMNLAFFAALSDYIIYWTTFAISTTVDTPVADFEDIDVGSFVNSFGTLLFATFFGLSIRMARDGVALRSKQRAAELKQLKAQLNPHFLFNTLNNLYGLAVVKSDKLPQLMLKLSELLRYGLYETQEKWVSLESEIKYIENYITLEKLRLDTGHHIHFKIEGEIANQRIAPLLLIVFLENAFKHFDANDTLPATIEVCLSLKGEQLQFSCYNTVNPSLEESPRAKNTSGIGLANVRKRLELLYPGRHQLKIQKQSTSFNVILELQLDSLTYDNSLPGS